MWPFKRKYIIEPIVQMDEKGNPCICGCYLKKLIFIEIKAYSFKEAEQQVLTILNQCYPQYKGLIQSF